MKNEYYDSGSGRKARGALIPSKDRTSTGHQFQWFEPMWLVKVILRQPPSLHPSKQSAQPASQASRKTC